MALVTCKECGREVSEHAITCPYCEISEPGSDPEKSAKTAARRSARKAIIGCVVTGLLYYQVYIGPELLCGNESDSPWHDRSLVCRILFWIDR